MSRLQELHPDQQAVLQLVLGRRMPYDALAGMLGLSPEGVRERALDAIDGLAPDDVDGLALEDRDRIADHLLGQDSGAEREATAALIAEHPPAAAWAATVVAELAPLGGAAVELPPAPDDVAPDDAATDAADAAAAPDADGAAVPDEAAEADAVPGAGAPAYQAPASGRPVYGAAAAADLGTDAGAGAAARPRPGRRPSRPGAGVLSGLSTRALAGGAVALLVVVLLLLWIGGAFGGGSDDDGSTAASAPPAASTTTGAAAPNAPPTAEERAAAAQFVAALPKTIAFRPRASATPRFRRVRGTARPAVSASNAATPVLALTITGLPALTQSRRYFAWADKNGADPIFLGQLTDAGGAELPFQGLDLKTRQAAVVDPTVYNRVRITLEGTAAPTKPGPTVLVGTITPRT